MSRYSSEEKKQMVSFQEINIDQFYRRYAPMVLRRCVRLLNDEEKALDAMQEVFVKLLINRKRLKNQYPSSLLFRISTNTCLNMLRDQQKHAKSERENFLTNIAVSDNSEKRVMIKDLLQKIFKKEKESTREIAVLHFVDGMTLQEVADEVGLSLSGVRKRIRELRQRIEIRKEKFYEE
jgi:RNA polymerase sigma-70 factor (ECF subfamily)